MASAAFPTMIAAVLTTATNAAPGCRVVRGKGVSLDSGDVMMIGLQSIDETQSDWASAGDFQQTRQSFGGNREEVGTVYGTVLAWNGDADPDAACTKAFDYIATLENAVRADPTLGLTAFDYVVTDFQAGSVIESQNNSGATAVVSFSIAYKVRI